MAQDILTTTETIVKFLKQPSTLKGLAGIAGAIGVSVAPNQIAAILTAVLSIVGAIDVFTDEDKPKEKIKKDIDEASKKTKDEIKSEVKASALK